MSNEKQKTIELPIIYKNGKKSQIEIPLFYYTDEYGNEEIDREKTIEYFTECVKKLNEFLKYNKN